MAKPVISSITPFDVANGTIIKFAYAGAQPYSNKVTIYKASNLSVVWEDTENTMQLRHTIPEGLSELDNGVQYAIELICYDVNGNASVPSSKVFFWCLEEPSFYFTTVEEGAVYDTGTIVANVYYNQQNGDGIASYKFHLYDSTRAEIYVSEMLYDSANISHTFRGLDNLTSYYVRCEGISQRGVYCDTGYVQFFIKYQNPASYARLYTTPRDGNGIVDYYTNLIVIEDRSGKKYEYINSMIILDDDDLTYDAGFDISGDFTLAIKHIYAVGTILRCMNDKYKFELDVVPTEEDNYFRYRLKVQNRICDYILYSDAFLMDAVTTCVCWIRRIGNLYQLKFFNKEDFSEMNNLWLYDHEPGSLADEYDTWLDLENKTTRIAKNDVVIWNQIEEPINADEDNIWLGGDEV